MCTVVSCTPTHMYLVSWLWAGPRGECCGQFSQALAALITGQSEPRVDEIGQPVCGRGWGDSRRLRAASRPRWSTCWGGVNTVPLRRQEVPGADGWFGWTEKFSLHRSVWPDSLLSICRHDVWHVFGLFLTYTHTSPHTQQRKFWFSFGYDVAQVSKRENTWT